MQKHILQKKTQNIFVFVKNTSPSHVVTWPQPQPGLRALSPSPWLSVQGGARPLIGKAWAPNSFGDSPSMGTGLSHQAVTLLCSWVDSC